MTSESIDMFQNAPIDPSKATMALPEDRWPTTLAELVDVLRATFVRRGQSDATALDAAQSVVLAISQHLGGKQIYLPTGERLRAAVRDRRIYLEYNGRNREELARRYQLTTRRIETIAAEQRAIYVRRLQPDLFGPAGGS